MYSLDPPQASQNDDRKTKKIAKEPAQSPETVDLLNQPTWTHHLQAACHEESKCLIV